MSDNERSLLQLPLSFSQLFQLRNEAGEFVKPLNDPVFGIVNPYEWSIDVQASFDPSHDRGTLPVHTSLGAALAAEYTFLRTLPEAA